MTCGVRTRVGPDDRQYTCDWSLRVSGMSCCCGNIVLNLETLTMEITMNFRGQTGIACVERSRYRQQASRAIDLWTAL